MMRTYQNQPNDQEDDVKFFTGVEVEKSPAFGLRTLFVVGVQSIEQIRQNLTPDIEHIYFGANMSFTEVQAHDFQAWRQWEQMVDYFLDQGYLCTLDIPYSCVEGLLESLLVEHYNFIPMISVKLPYLQQLGYNATIKLDDKGFAATNPGVWCHRLHDLLNKDNFTNWNQYKKDSIIKS